VAVVVVEVVGRVDHVQPCRGSMCSIWIPDRSRFWRLLILPGPRRSVMKDMLENMNKITSEFYVLLLHCEE